MGSLNLTIATQVHLLEPQWNPSVESQAVGRVLRLTQEKPVVITRYIMEDTIELVNIYLGCFYCHRWGTNEAFRMFRNDKI